MDDETKALASELGLHPSDYVGQAELVSQFGNLLRSTHADANSAGIVHFDVGSGSLYRSSIGSSGPLRSGVNIDSKGVFKIQASSLERLPTDVMFNEIIVDMEPESIFALRNTSNALKDLVESAVRQHNIVLFAESKFLSDRRKSRWQSTELGNPYLRESLAGASAEYILKLYYKVVYFPYSKDLIETRPEALGALVWTQPYLFSTLGTNSTHDVAFPGPDRKFIRLPLQTLGSAQHYEDTGPLPEAMEHFVSDLTPLNLLAFGIPNDDVLMLHTLAMQIFSVPNIPAIWNYLTLVTPTRGLGYAVSYINRGTKPRKGDDPGQIHYIKLPSPFPDFLTFPDKKTATASNTYLRHKERYFEGVKYQIDAVQLGILMHSNDCVGYLMNATEHLKFYSDFDWPDLDMWLRYGRLASVAFNTEALKLILQLDKAPIMLADGERSKKMRNGSDFWSFLTQDLLFLHRTDYLWRAYLGIVDYEQYRDVVGQSHIPVPPELVDHGRGQLARETHRYILAARTFARRTLPMLIDWIMEVSPSENRSEFATRVSVVFSGDFLNSRGLYFKIWAAVLRRQRTKEDFMYSWRALGFDQAKWLTTSGSSFQQLIAALQTYNSNSPIEEGIEFGENVDAFQNALLDNADAPFSTAMTLPEYVSSIFETESKCDVCRAMENEELVYSKFRIYPELPKDWPTRFSNVIEIFVNQSTPRGAEILKKESSSKV